MRKIPLAVQLLAAVALGVIAGRLLGPNAAVLGALALVYVKLLKLFAVPLVFLAIVDTLCSTRIAFRQAGVMIGLSAMNALVAAGLALGTCRLLPVRRLVDLDAIKRAIEAAPGAQAGAGGAAHAVEAFGSAVIEPLLIDNLLLVIGAAIVIGLMVRRLRRPRVERLAKRGLAVLMRGLRVLVAVVPWAAFGVVAKVVGTTGFGALPALGVFVGLVTTCIALHVLGWYGLLVRVLARRSPRAFLGAASEALLTALSTGSSLATLPVTLRTLDEKLGVSPESARLAACVGTNLNHDGIILYEAAAALFVAQIYGVDPGFGAQLKIVGMSVVAAIGIAGVPEAGLITLALVLGAVGLPVAAVPLLLPVDWLLGRLRATANVASDLVVATLLDRLKPPRSPID